MLRRPLSQHLSDLAPLLCGLVICLSAWPHAQTSSLPAKDLARFKPIAEGIRAATTLTVYEGLPHQGYQREMLEKELATKKTIQLHGFPFYEKTLAVTPELTTALRQIASAATSYEEYSGPKKCGGYHPDYALSWQTTDGIRCDLLICFGCGEVKLFRTRAEKTGKELLVDLRNEALDQFEGLLKPLQSQRPKGKKE